MFLSIAFAYMYVCIVFVCMYACMYLTLQSGRAALLIIVRLNYQSQSQHRTATLCQVILEGGMPEIFELIVAIAWVAISTTL